MKKIKELIKKSVYMFNEADAELLGYSTAIVTIDGKNKEIKFTKIYDNEDFLFLSKNNHNFKGKEFVGVFENWQVTNIKEHYTNEKVPLNKGGERVYMFNEKEAELKGYSTAKVNNVCIPQEIKFTRDYDSEDEASVLLYEIKGAKIVGTFIDVSEIKKHEIIRERVYMFNEKEAELKGYSTVEVNENAMIRKIKFTRAYDSKDEASVLFYEKQGAKIVGKFTNDNVSKEIKHDVAVGFELPNTENKIKEINFAEIKKRSI